MSSIDRLAILGIRSFSPDEPSYIKFYAPITLIVGPNGSGKTTIIECLRYACTGDLPPNSKGGAFIHDTKMAGVAEVKAQVRLKFIDVNGQRLVSSRSMSLTQKKNTVQQKTLDNTLQRHDPNTGEVTSVSSRCADMDALLPLYLGVPKSILDNVVFCHQEESNWPLSEPSVLKKKFDEIFSSTKYTKALGSIKDIRKERAQDVRVDQVKLAGLKTDSEKSQRIQEALDDLQRQVGAKKEQVTRVDYQLAETSRKIESLLEVHKTVEDLERRISEVSHERKMLENNINELGRTLPARSESDDELRTLQQSCQEGVQADEEKLSDLRFSKTRLESRLQDGRNEISSKLTELGRLQAAHEANEQRLSRRHEVIETAQRAMDASLDTNPVEAVETLSRIVLEREADLSRTKQDAASEQRTLNDKLQKQRSDKAAAEEAIKYASQQLNEKQTVMATTRRQLSEIRGSGAEHMMAKERLEKEQSSLDRLRALSAKVNTNDELRQKENDLKQLDDNLHQLHEEITCLSRQGDTRARLSLRRSERDQKRSSVRALFDACSSTLQQALNKNPSLDTLEQDLHTLVQRVSETLGQAKAELTSVTREYSAVDARLVMAKDQYEEKLQEAEVMEKAVKDVCGDKAFPDELREVSQRLQDYRHKIAAFGGAELMYKRFLQKTSRDSLCPLCTRSFNNDHALTDFMSKLEQTMAKIPQQQMELHESEIACQAREQELLAIQGTWNRLQHLRDNDIASLASTVEESKTSFSTAKEKVDVASRRVREREAEQERLQAMMKRAEDITRQQKEVVVIEEDIRHLEAELLKTGTTRTAQDCQREMESLSEQSKNIRHDIQRIHQDRDVSIRELQQAEHAAHEAREAVLSLQYKVEQHGRLEEALERAQKDYQSHMATLRDMEAKVPALDDQVQQTVALASAAEERWQHSISELESSLYQARKYTDELTTLNQAIATFTQTSTSNTLDQIEKEKKKAERQVEQLALETEDVEHAIRGLEKNMMERKGTERELSDQLRFRSMQEQAVTCDETLSRLRTEAGQLDTSSYTQQLQQLQQAQSSGIDTRGRLHGEIRQIQNQVDRYRRELDTDYRQVEERYHHQYVQVKTNEMAVTDLDKYSKALETAIMRYHSLKMQDLNKIIRELWVNTYRGGDIDYIAIRSDNEGSASNRSFNYRVVMVKGGAELNMRGRCSAGQKVLASILIRLALAETFCINCGILTLDEPTTNLDRDNVESLAESLVRIIQTRRVQSNFQLVVITHDEEFVEHLARSDVTDYYYRVSKDDRHYSEIKRQAIQMEDQQAL